MNYQHYERMPVLNLKDRQWPSRIQTEAPIWCSVDLRDGNQALEVPMNISQKLDFFKYLVKIGFKEIEIGFPAASKTDYEFARRLIEDNLIPDDVSIQVLTLARESTIKETFEAVRGARNVIIHLFNATNTVQRELVFGFNKEECKEFAVSGTQIIKDYIARDNNGTRFIFEYSPEGFSATEPDFAVEVCNSVLEVYTPSAEDKVIINLPETVEMSTPNVYADQIEYFCRNIKYRDNVIVSIHTHNDRGTAIASSELGLLAGAQRIEGTLFGNGERTGNADITVLAINMMMLGIDPKLDFSNIDEAISVFEENTSMTVSERHPWSGKLVFTAFSGAHQDAIKKGIDKLNQNADDKWSVPYLPIDPKDVGRSYEPIIRINSQSGKGGVAFIMREIFGLNLPRSFQKEFSKLIKDKSCEEDIELQPQQIFDLFDDEYINYFNPYCLDKFREISHEDKYSEVEAIISKGDETRRFVGHGNGFLDAFVNAVNQFPDVDVTINMYSEHSMKSGSDSAAITYIEIIDKKTDTVHLGAGVSSSVTKSSVRAVISAVNRMIKAKM